jgi:hypothetical protein
LILLLVYYLGCLLRLFELSKSRATFGYFRCYGKTKLPGQVFRFRVPFETAAIGCATWHQTQLIRPPTGNTRRSQFPPSHTVSTELFIALRTKRAIGLPVSRIVKTVVESFMVDTTKPLSQ